MNVEEFISALRLTQLHINCALADLQLANIYLERGEYEGVTPSMKSSEANLTFARYFYERAKV